MTQGKCAELDAKILELVRNGADTFNALVVRRDINKLTAPHETATTETTKPLTPKNTSPEKAPAIDRVCEISSHFIKLAASMKSLADDLETAAIELADQQQRSEDDVAKLKQLQQLLKSIGG